MKQLARLVPELRNRPGMYLPDDRYATLVAFVEGVAQGETGEALSAFSAWLTKDGEASSLHWQALIAMRAVPRLISQYPGPWVLTLEEEQSAKGALLDQLASFLSELDPTA